MQTEEHNDNTMNILNQQLTNISAENQFVTFRVDDEEYGVDVLKVQEIIRYHQPTKVPNAPEVIKGVINFRGEVIPIVDLRKKFNLELREYDSFTVIIILEVKDKIVGIIVDHVSDILSFSKEDIQTALEFSSDIKTEFIKGMAKLDERLIILLELEKLLSFKEFRALNRLDEGEMSEEGQVTDKKEDIVKDESDDELIEDDG
ncbi:chemotaxis protein CheW [Selenihalanaerobacter shriftii]|uniref:Chemotaxis protein CheW n=1 Tax=Selenihalanaerobacter shriftii TaxID=142842 RepID=A0A1T4KF20_9FIRM|nr:chemotaxis protein CheW [Selenihalanaerobacter shriftii]SJZ40935.1 purine-binding chemotaxis protein CheW [Selenihalanaerobacter shriftii]